MFKTAILDVPKVDMDGGQAIAYLFPGNRFVPRKHQHIVRCQHDLLDDPKTRPVGALQEIVKRKPLSVAESSWVRLQLRQHTGR